MDRPLWGAVSNSCMLYAGLSVTQAIQTEITFSLLLNAIHNKWKSVYFSSRSVNVIIPPALFLKKSINKRLTTPEPPLTAVNSFSS